MVIKEWRGLVVGTGALHTPTFLARLGAGPPEALHLWDELFGWMPSIVGDCAHSCEAQKVSRARLGGLPKGLPFLARLARVWRSLVSPTTWCALGS